MTTIALPVEETVTDQLDAAQHDELLRLFNRVDALLDTNPSRSVLLVGPSAGVGASSVARGLAAIASERQGAKVLLLDADTTKERAEDDPRARGVIGCLERGEDPLTAVVPATSSSQGRAYDFARLVDLALPRGHALPPGLIERALQALRNEYRWLVIDAAPLQAAAETMPIARMVDAVAVVVEAETTRIPVTQRLLQELKLGGANPIGIVLNKRRFYIPTWIYRRL
jgi:Mrp family chromosome partitioning ATPase